MAEEGKREVSQERTPILGREVGKPLRPEEYPSEEEIASLTGEIGASRLEIVLKTMGMAAPVLIAPILTRCVPTPTEIPVVRTPEEAGVTPSPTLEIKPTPTKTPTPEIIPSPTVTVEAIGFGMEELTPEKQEKEQEMATELEQAYREAAKKGGFEAGTIVLTHGDEEGEVGGYFKDEEGNFWLLVTKEEQKVLKQVPSYQEETPIWNANEMRFEINDEEGKVIAYWNPEESVWKAIAPESIPTPTKEPTATPEPQPPVEMVATGNVDIYLSPEGQKVGYFVPGQRFTPTGVEKDGWIQVIDSDGNRLWIQEGGPYGPAGKATPIPEVTPLPEHPFCPEIPPGFWNPYGAPQASIQRYGGWEYFPVYQYFLYGQTIDQGRRNADGSISTRIKINLSGTGLLEAEYILPSGLPIKRIISGEDHVINPLDYPSISPEEVCSGDVVIITSISSPDVLDPRIPGPHVLDGPFFIMRFRQ